MITENDFTFMIERLSAKLNHRISAPQIFALYEELNWLTTAQLEQVIEKLKYDERFPTLSKFITTLQTLGIKKGGIDSGGLRELSCKKCGAKVWARQSDKGIVDCPNVIYEKCDHKIIVG